MSTFRNTLFDPSLYALPMNVEQSIPKLRHIKFRRREITQKKTYKMPSSCIRSTTATHDVKTCLSEKYRWITKL
jgi:hypothetical protein